MQAAFHSPLHRLVCTCLAAILAIASGCYWTWSNAQGDPFPAPLQVETLPLSAGLTLNGLSNAPEAPSIPPGAVAEDLAERMAKEKVFETVIYPLTPLAQVRPDVVFDVTVRIEEDKHWGENIIKAIFTGATLLLLGPVLPTHYTVVVELSAKADGAGGAEIGSYRYRSDYDYYYTTMTPSGTKMAEWLTTAQSHAVEDVLVQIKRDRHRFLELAKPAPTASERMVD